MDARKRIIIFLILSFTTAFSEVNRTVAVPAVNPFMLTTNENGRDFSADTRDYILTTLSLMNELGIQTRDTFSTDANFDDFISNGRYGGPRLLKIMESATADFTHVAGKRYQIPTRRDTAYDSYVIERLQRLKGRDDPIIHECVHFLQRSTDQEEKNYVYFNGKNYPDYIRQRSEFEAHLVQVLYIVKHDRPRLQSLLKPEKIAELEEMLAIYKKTHAEGAGFQAIFMCNKAGVI